MLRVALKVSRVGEVRNPSHFLQSCGLGCLPHLLQAAGPWAHRGPDDSVVTPGDLGPCGRPELWLFLLFQGRCSGSLSPSQVSQQPSRVGLSWGWAVRVRRPHSIGSGLQRHDRYQIQRLSASSMGRHIRAADSPGLPTPSVDLHSPIFIHRF